MKLIISNVSGVPIYEQIKQQVKAAILSGELKEEEALPSLRTLAKDLKISVLTVTRAYTELEQEGFVKNVQGRGCFVLGSGSELMKEQLICKVENGLTEAIKAAKIANLSNEELHHLLDILLRRIQMTNYLEVKNLSKSFDSFQLHNITFTLPKGYIMGLIGPNGSGKTTTIKLILNMLKRNGGEIKIMGLDNIADEQKAKAELGVVFDTNYFSDDWKVSEVEKSISVFYPNWNSERFSEMLQKFHIAPTKKVKELSKGMQMKLMLACAFSYDAKLLILDEPTSGLDPVSRDELLQILSEYIEDGEHSVLFSTHITGDLERAADYITYISYGELFFTGSKDEFVDMFRIVKGGMDELSADLQAKAVGVRTFPTGFEALVKTEDIGSFTALDIEPATIDEIVVFTSKKGEDYE